MATVDSQVNDPSVSASLFQCRAIVERIAEGFPPSEYPPEAIRILRVFLLLVSRVESRLLAVQTQRGRTPAGELRPLGDLATARVIHLAGLLRTIYACLRFIHASDPRSTPPEIQTAINRLVQEYVIPTLGCPAECVVVLVRPRWTVPNFVDLFGYLERQIEVASLDPEGATTSLRELIEADWKAAACEGSPPLHVAVVSFAGSDVHDALLYPLLAHEVGHFIQAAFQGGDATPYPLAPGTWVILSQEVQELFDAEYPPQSPSSSADEYRREKVGDLWRHANRLVETCVSEIVSDLLAVRMLGMPYFIAAAEYLKTFSGWPEEDVTESGYPGIDYRLRLIYGELTAGEGGLDALRELEQVPPGPTPAAKASVGRIVEYLKSWGGRLQPHSPRGVATPSSPSASASWRTRRSRESFRR